MKYIAAIAIAGLLVLAYRAYQVRRIRSHVWSIGGRYPLPVDTPHEFNFRVSFPTAAQAAQCCSLVDRPGLTGHTEPSPNGQRWAAVWETTMLALPATYMEIIAAIHAASVQSGVSDATIVATASLPGSGAALLLHAG
jgi:hypothetical protein